MKNTKCAHCNKDAYLGFQCKRCGGYFCAKHRLPETHNCAFKNMKSEEVAIRMQLEKGGERRATQRMPINDTPENERRMYGDKSEPRAYEDDEEDSDVSMRLGGGMVGSVNLVFGLVVFLIFAGMDLAFFLMFQNPFMLLPLIVHAVFLPFLFYIAIKQKRGLLPPKAMVGFIQLIIGYMLVYTGVEIVVAIVQGNFLMIGIYLFFGICLLVFLNRVLQQLKYVLGRQ
ncbi:MAG: AN1-type zinc finger domain-containing protein [Candidatus Sigynarchaeota archaeon]